MVTVVVNYKIELLIIKLNVYNVIDLDYLHYLNRD